MPVASPSTAKVWWIALRPFSFPASVMSVVFGSLLAVVFTDAALSVRVLVLATVAMAVLHGGANVLNDVYDFRRGLDRQVLPVSGAVVRGHLSPGRAARGAALLLAVGATLGLVLAYLVGWVVLFIGVAGVAVGVLYSATPAGLKYHALGDLSVFLNFGILGSLGGWVTQTGSPAWLPVVWSVPLSLLVVGILHANNWRDIEGDTSKGCTTVASLLGDQRSALYYGFLLFAPFALVAAFIAVPRFTGIGTAMPLTFGVTLLALPVAARLMVRGLRRRSPRDPMHFLALDGATAQLNLLFGLLSALAIGLHAWLGPTG